MFFVKQSWKDLGAKISSFQSDGKFTDIDLVVDNQVFSGHKVILAGSSPYFEAMFSTELCEKDKTKIEIHGLSKELFQVLLDYIYERKFEINEDNVQEILDGSNMLQLTSLTSSCCKFLKKKLNEKNVVAIYRLVDVYSSTESLLNLKRKCKFFIEQHFLNIVKNDEILDLPFHLFENLVKSESLSIHYELDVFKVTLNWIQKDPEERTKHIYLLMKYVRLPTIPENKKNCLIESVQHNELKLILNEIVKQDLSKNNSKKSPSTIEQQPQLNGLQGPLQRIHENEDFRDLINFNFRWKPRIKCSQMFYLIGGRSESSANAPDHLKVSSEIIRIDSFSFKFTNLNRLQVGRCNHQSVALDGSSCLYIAGGINSNKMHLKLVEAYDYYENEIVNVSYMINSRQDFGLINYDGGLLAIGGSFMYPNLIERFDPKTNQWSNFDSIADLPIIGFRVQKVKNLIYIIGGVNKFNQLLDQTLCYNPETGQVKRLSRMRQARASFGSIYAFGYIYVVGGCVATNMNNKCTTERYSLIEDQWSYIADLERPVMNCSVTVAFNKLCVIGGEDPNTNTTSNKIYCYDPERNQWTSKDLPFRISGASLISYADLKV